MAREGGGGLSTYILSGLRELSLGNSMKKSRQPTLIVNWLLLPSLSLLFLAVTVIASAQQYVVPCHFNPMCSCKMSQTPSRPLVDPETDGGGGGGGGGGYANEPETDGRNRTLTELEALLSEEIDRGRRLKQDTSSPGDGTSSDQENVFDVSCVGVPFAFLPGKISHVDIVNSGLEVADRIPAWKTSPSTSASQSRIRIESLRLMSNKIRHIGEHIFSGMEEDLKSLDLSYNELNEIPVAPLKTLQSLVWANFHK
ncbi:hypothetical protein DAPPUDRAFT_104156 [Daphnia pulex]|uniref:Uncharacterized protein n=1 Tax=Daphnia pulex TaxID=6669 RepID=E9GLE3_DAPPU|nr:hypothetical protein DAPPUDRAFT_104156 [Daphnia pulex]|eukprot:EFX79496.1 hypothetical protein DAPPUDRAFT_104156 [Daphnia pulex]